MTRVEALLAALEAVHGPMPKDMSRFLEKAYRVPPDEDQEVGCLIWMGARSKGGGRSGGEGYGSFFLNRRLNAVRAHVYMATAIGLVQDFRSPEGMHIDHVCCRSLCVEPTHFQLLPGRDNVRLRHLERARPLSEDQMAALRYRGIDR